MGEFRMERKRLRNEEPSLNEERPLDLPSRPQGLGRSFRMAHRLYTRRLQEIVAEYDLSLAQYLHISELWRRDGVAQNELSQMIGIEKASSTAVLDRLETLGLIDRVRNSQDRRKVNVYLSEKGRRFAANVLPAAKHVAVQAVAGLSDAELAQFQTTLEKVMRNMSSPSPPQT